MNKRKAIGWIMLGIPYVGSFFMFPMVITGITLGVAVIVYAVVAVTLILER